MSIFTKQSIFECFPAYDVFKRDTDQIGFVNITANDVLGLRVLNSNGSTDYFRTYSACSVVSYSLQYNECPIAALEDAKAKGEDLHWINGRGAMLSASPIKKENLVFVEYGMKVRFEGLLATIEKDHNSNLKFVPIK